RQRSACETIPATIHKGLVMNASLLVLSIGLCALAAAAQTAKDVKGATPLVAVPNEPPVKLVMRTRPGKWAVRPLLPNRSNSGGRHHGVRLADEGKEGE